MGARAARGDRSQLVTREERQTLATETPGDVAAEESRAPDAQSSTGAAYALELVEVKQALAHVQDTSLPIEQRAQSYASLRVLKLAIDRALREPGRELQAILAALAAEHGEHVQYGPLKLKWRAVGVAWPVNDPGNWTDDGVQQLLHDWQAALGELEGDEAIITEVPEHLEVNTRALGAAVHAGIRSARAFWSELNDQRLRVEEARAASLEVVDTAP